MHEEVDIASHVAAAYSLLPREKAIGEIRQTLDTLAKGIEHEPAELRWAEFTATGEYLRGGATDLGDGTTRLFVAPSEDDEVAAMSDLVPDCGNGSLVVDETSNRCVWFVPQADTDGRTTLICGISVAVPLLRQLLSIFNSAANLTAAELRVVLQITLGGTPKSAAAEDSVSVETKRLQLKGAFSKLGCKSQTELVRKTLSQLSYLFSARQSEDAAAVVTEAFVQKWLTEDARLFVNRVPDRKRNKPRRPLRVLACGPADGTPVVMIHGMMWPLILRGVRPWLEDARIRLIMPLRRGHLEPISSNDLQHSGDLAADGLDDIAHYIRAEFSGPATILGNSLGAVLATSFANRHPDLVQQLVLLSINLTQTQPSDGNRAGHFYNGLNRLSVRRDLFHEVSQRYREHYADQATCRDILLALFGASETDVRVLEGEHSASPAYKMFGESYGASVAGMAEDFVHVMRNWRAEIQGLEVPTVFVHGSEDPLTRTDEFTGVLTGKPNISAITIQGGGHFLAVSHGAETWKTIARIARSPAGADTSTGSQTHDFGAGGFAGANASALSARLRGRGD